ncbi:MAG: FAD binding domain-containing protein [Microbacteriaceae bacterium]
MDITTVTSFRAARSRADLALAPGEAFMAGGTWLLSEPQPSTTGFVDLTAMGWPDIEVDDAGLRIGATCTIATLLDWARGAAVSSRPTEGPAATGRWARADALPPVPEAWRAVALIEPAANALLASFKIWSTATVGGNLCQSFAAGSMISFAVALDGVAVVWQPDGAERRMPVAELPAGNGANALARGEVLRAIEIPAHALRSEARLQKIALAELGRSGAVVTGRVDDDGAATFGVTAATITPRVLRFAALPSAEALRDRVTALDGYYSDPLGAEDWRRGVSAVLAERIRSQLQEAIAGRADAAAAASPAPSDDGSARA